MGACGLVIDRDVMDWLSLKFIDQSRLCYVLVVIEQTRSRPSMEVFSVTFPTEETVNLPSRVEAFSTGELDTNVIGCILLSVQNRCHSTCIFLSARLSKSRPSSTCHGAVQGMSSLLGIAKGSHVFLSTCLAIPKFRNPRSIKLDLLGLDLYLSRN